MYEPQMNPGSAGPHHETTKRDYPYKALNFSASQATTVQKYKALG